MTRDLIFSSRVLAAAEQANLRAVECATVDETVAQAHALSATLVIVDLTCPDIRRHLTKLVDQLRQGSPDVRVLGCGPHVQTGLLQQAADAGFDEVLTRGSFHRDITSIFSNARGA